MAKTKGSISRTPCKRRGPVSAGTIVAVSAAVVTIFKLNWCLADIGAYSFISESDVLTTFERKLGLLDFDAGTTNDPEPTDAPVEKPLDGYRLLNVSAVQTLVAVLLCPKCHGELLSLREEGIGVNLQFVVSCSTCGDIVVTTHSPSIGKSRQNELAVRLGVVGRDCGISVTKLTNLFGGLNAPPPMHVN
ncbi:unnamed protein product [Ixodes hexagonus]